MKQAHGVAFVERLRARFMALRPGERDALLAFLRSLQPVISLRSWKATGLRR